MFYEDKFLLYLSNPNGNEQLLQQVKDIPFTSLDWRYIIGKSIHHRVFPILSQNLFFLAANSHNLIPQEVLEKVREVNYSFIGQSIVVYEEIRRIFQSLINEGIEFTPIKGVLLAEIVYPERHLRFFKDVDLLFPNVSEMRSAEETLIKLGYDFFWTNSRGSTFKKRKQGISIDCDLHRSFSLFLFHEYPCSRSLIEDLWRKSSKQRVRGVKVTAMSAEHMLFMVCIHSFYHRFFSLLDLIDAIQIMRKNPGLDWEFILKKIKEYPCALGLPISIIHSVCTDFFKIKIMPEAIINAINDDNTMISRINWKSVKRSLGELQYPVSYMKFCNGCVENCVYKATLMDTPENQTRKKISKYIHEYTYGYYCIMTLARKRYGIKYAVKCFVQQLAAPLGFLIGKSMKILGKKASMLGFQELLWL